MDLRTWILDDLHSLRARLDGAVLDVVPHDRRGDRVGGGISTTYVLWHLARHHDLAVNRVLRDRDELVEAWTPRLGVSHDLWRGLAEAEDVDLVAQLDHEAVDGYVLAVLDGTAAWLADAALSRLDRPVHAEPALHALGVPRDRFDWLYAMWEGRPAAFFVSWEAIGHGVSHLGELIATRNRMGLSPF